MSEVPLKEGRTGNSDHGTATNLRASGMHQVPMGSKSTQRGPRILRMPYGRTYGPAHQLRNTYS